MTNTAKSRESVPIGGPPLPLLCDAIDEFYDGEKGSPIGTISMYHTVKFRYSEKATKFWPIFHFLLDIT